MPNYSFLKNILVEIEQFKSEKGGYPQNIKEFSYWLFYDRLTEEERQLEISQRMISYGKDMDGSIQNMASNFFTSMHRFKMYYIKILLENSALETYDEFSFLSSIHFCGSYTHARLIEKHLQNKATGTEIIRRLIRKDLIVQTPSTDDKRNKILSITDKGKTLLLSLMGKVSLISNFLLFPLSQKEIFSLVSILEKMDNAHREIFEKEKRLTLDDILEKYKLTFLADNIN